MRVKRLNINYDEIARRYSKLDLFYSVKTPSVGPPEPLIRYTFLDHLQVHKMWVDIVANAEYLPNNRTGLNAYIFETIHFTFHKKKIVSTIRRSRAYMLLLKLVHSRTNRTNLMLNIDIKTKKPRPIYQTWKQNVIFSSNHTFMCVAFSGNIQHISFLNIKKDNFLFNIYWIHNNYEQYHYYKTKNPTKCNIKINCHQYCQNYSTVNEKYGKENHYFIFIWNRDKRFTSLYIQQRKITYHKASEFCDSVGGYLPIMRSKDEMHKLISLLKLSEDILPVEALYIGLTRNYKEKVKAIFDSKVSELWLIQISSKYLVKDLGITTKFIVYSKLF